MTETGDLAGHQLLADGVVADQSELVWLAGVTQPRVTQILNLLYLAQGIQEALLFLPRVTDGKDPLTERDLRVIVAEVNWERQRELIMVISLPPRPSSVDAV